MLNILDFRNYVNLNKRLQRMMFSSGCTIKGMLSRALVLERVERVWILAQMCTIEGKGFAAPSYQGLTFSM